MDKSDKKDYPNPYLTANPLSKLFFWWLNPLFSRGYGRILEADDMYNACPSDQSSNLGNKLEREWHREMLRHKDGETKPSLAGVLFRMFGKEYMLLGLLLVIREAAKISQPLILGRLIRYFSSNSGVAKWEAYTYALAMTVCAVILVVTFHPYVFHVMRLGMRMKIACNSLMYRKSLRLSSGGLGRTTPGQIINLMSNDVGKFDYAFVRMMYLVLGPLDVIAIHVILWQSLGPSVLAGFAILVLLIPLQGLMGKLVSKFASRIARHTDERVRMMNEIIAGIQVIKLHCWEEPFSEWVSDIRRLETKQIRNLGYVRAVATGPFFISAKLMALAVFVTYSLVGGVVTAEPVFVAMSMYESVRLSATSYVSYAITQVSEVRVAIKRIEAFLQLPEKEEKPEHELYPGMKNKEAGIALTGVSADWHETSEHPTLFDISLTVGPGKLLIIIGPVGAGKTTLLKTLLGEVPHSVGKVNVTGQLTYVSQTPWVFSSTIRQNVTLGKPFIKEKYEAILKACALNKDIATMPHGDMTLIGDRGASLSGGQRARISLARAIYMDGDVYLLDDPFSSVDTPIGRHIFKHVIEGILRDKPRILVTHQQQFLKYADEILILQQGKIVDSGGRDKLTASGVDLTSFLCHKSETDDTYLYPLSLQSAPRSTPKITRARRFSRNESILSTLSLKETEMESLQDQGTNAELREEEERQIGSVGWVVYFSYFKAGAGIVKSLMFIVVCLSVIGVYVFSDYWLSNWSKARQLKRPGEGISSANDTTTNVTLTKHETYFYVSVYSGLIVGVFILELIRTIFFFRIAVNSSKNLHNKMLTRLLRSNIAFFATNPIGRILNRFSKDIGLIDNRIPDLVFNILQCSLLILSMVFVVGVINPWTFIFVLPICVLLLVVRRYYLRTSRDVHRLEGIARSPVYSLISSTLEGLDTIRSCKVQERFAYEFDQHQDSHTRAYFLLIGTTSWLGMRLDFLSALFLSAVTFSCVLASDSLNPALIGLTMTYAITGTGIFQWTVKSSADLENQMISVERVHEYSKLPTEAANESQTKPPSGWPSHGVIHAEELCLRYNKDGPLVIKGISFNVIPKEKVGIVGRSGAGKSSLISVLFRLVEPEGKLVIDGINIQTIGLNVLRNKISIIPQDPVLFKGNLRRNLDPVNKHEDSSLWNVLKDVEMYDTVQNLTGGLDAEIIEGGLNFSLGQRQLICLARALLRRTNILVVDEATANVDHRTDKLIQETIREKFRDYTVLTVAHRLQTVIDSDRIMVLDSGRIVEFDIPYLLLTKSEGLLSTMVHQTGALESKRLIQAAKVAYEKKSNVDVDVENNYKVQFYLPVEAMQRSTDTNAFDDINISAENGVVKDIATQENDSHVPAKQAQGAIHIKDVKVSEDKFRTDDGKSSEDPDDKENHSFDDLSRLNKINIETMVTRL